MNKYLLGLVISLPIFLVTVSLYLTIETPEEIDQSIANESLLWEPPYNKIIKEKTGLDVEVYDCHLHMCLLPRWIDACETSHGEIHIGFGAHERIVAVTDEEKEELFKINALVRVTDPQLY